MNRLFYGDNLDVLHRYIADASVDFIYLDPPFKSDQDYNVLYQEKDGSRAATISNTTISPLPNFEHRRLPDV